MVSNSTPHPPIHRDKCPGQKECDAAIDSLNATINELDQAVLAAMSQQLQPYASSTLQGFQVCTCYITCKWNNCYIDM